MEKRVDPPPLGLKPRKLHDEERTVEVLNAIRRSVAAGKDIPAEWVREYLELTQSEFMLGL